MDQVSREHFDRRKGEIYNISPNPDSDIVSAFFTRKVVSTERLI